MIRVLAATVLLTVAGSPCFACDWTHTTAVEGQSTTAAAQPAAPATCPTCVAPDHAAAPPALPTQQKPS